MQNARLRRCARELVGGLNLPGSGATDTVSRASLIALVVLFVSVASVRACSPPSIDRLEASLGIGDVAVKARIIAAMPLSGTKSELYPPIGSGLGEPNAASSQAVSDPELEATLHVLELETLETLKGPHRPTWRAIWRSGSFDTGRWVGKVGYMALSMPDAPSVFKRIADLLPQPPSWVPEPLPLRRGPNGKPLVEIFPYTDACACWMFEFCGAEPFTIPQSYASQFDATGFSDRWVAMRLLAAETAIAAEIVSVRKRKDVADLYANDLPLWSLCEPPIRDEAPHALELELRTVETYRRPAEDTWRVLWRGDAASLGIGEAGEEEASRLFELLPPGNPLPADLVPPGLTREATRMYAPVAGADGKPLTEIAPTGCACDTACLAKYEHPGKTALAIAKIEAEAAAERKVSPQD